MSPQLHWKEPALKDYEHHEACEAPDGGSCTCDLIAEYGAPGDDD